jgi:two-component system, NarL family, nitrate/nitrite response regulator NarL
LIRACIVSDVRLYRDGLAEILGGQRQIAVVASLAYGDGDLDEAEQLQPEVVLLDVAGSEGEAALRRFVGRLPEAHFVALTVSDSEAQIVACAEAGVEGFVTRTSSLTELVAAVESASHGESACSPKIAAVLLRRVQTLSRGREGFQNSGSVGRIGRSRWFRRGLDVHGRAREYQIALGFATH